MKPGRELDKLVAEVMGYTLVVDDQFGDVLGVTALGYSTVLDMPSYSTDIAAAWEAWEWLEENNPWPGCLPIIGRHKLFLEKGGGKPSVMVIADCYDGVFTEFPGESYPHAICLAVLEASKAK